MILNTISNVIQPDTLQCFLHSGLSAIPFRNSFSPVKQEFSFLLLFLLLSKPLYEIKYQVSSFNRALLMSLCILSRIAFSLKKSFLDLSCCSLHAAALTSNILWWFLYLTKEIGADCANSLLSLLNITPFWHSSQMLQGKI